MHELRLSDINAHLLCVLCGGYYIDATTITECNHSFCRSCIVKHLETSKFCPICDVQVNRIKPLASIRPDQTLQRLVYKVVPGLYQNELERRRQFYEDPEIQAQERAKSDYQLDILRLEPYDFFSPDDSISLSLEYHENTRTEDKKLLEKRAENLDEVQRRYLQCPAGVTMGHLKKFLRMKYGLRHDHKVDIFYMKKVIPETYSLIDVAYTFDWDQANPMRFGFQILEKHPVTVKNTNRVVVAESSPSSSLQEMALHNTSSRDAEGVPSDQSEQLGDLTLGKKKLRVMSNNCSMPEENPSPAKKLRIDSPLEENDIVDNSNDTSESSLKEVASEEFPITSPRPAEEQTLSVITESPRGGKQEEISQIPDSVEEKYLSDCSKDIEQDFILQDHQSMDIIEDLEEEDDDEDRLRICDPEEIIEDKNSDENTELIIDDSVQPELQDQNPESYIEEEIEVVRKEVKVKRRNKKAKHHHRHKRDYSPAPEATIVSDDNNDVLKLKVKINRVESENNQGKQRLKQEENSKSNRNDSHSSPRQSKHRSHTTTEDTESIHSPSNSNLDDDSRNSLSIDDHEIKNVGTSKEGQGEITKESPLQNGSIVKGSGYDKINKLQLKEKLTQMRQVRHKNITQSPPRTTIPNTTISKLNAEDVGKNTQKSPILLTSPSSSLTVSKVTAEEKMKMMTNNNIERNLPSLEIIMVNNPNNGSKINDNKAYENLIKHRSMMPIVKLTKTIPPNSLMPKQNAMSVSKMNKNSSDGSNKNSEKTNADTSRIGDKKSESFGVLDLSGKSTRSCESSPASEGSNSPSHSHNALPSQPRMNRHLVTMNNAHCSSSNSPPVTSTMHKDSPSRAAQHTSMWNLMTLTETAVKMRNMNANNQKHISPQRHPTTSSSPSKSPSSRGSPTPLKIPTPNITLTNKFNRSNLPPSSSSYVNAGRPIGINKPMVGLTRPMPSSPSARMNSSFTGMFPSQSAAVAKKQAGINGRSNIRSPPPAIPISALYAMPKKYDLEKITRGLSAASKAAAGIPSS